MHGRRRRRPSSPSTTEKVRLRFEAGVAPPPARQLQVDASEKEGVAVHSQTELHAAPPSAARSAAKGAVHTKYAANASEERRFDTLTKRKDKVGSEDEERKECAYVKQSIE